MGRHKQPQWYVTRKPDTKVYQLYDFARSAEQAKQMLKDLAEGEAIAHKSRSEGGNYNIYVKKGTVLWREDGGKAGATIVKSKKHPAREHVEVRIIGDDENGYDVVHYNTKSSSSLKGAHFSDLESAEKFYNELGDKGKFTYVAEGRYADGTRYMKHDDSLEEAMDRVAEYSDEELNKESIYYFKEFEDGSREQAYAGGGKTGDLSGYYYSTGRFVQENGLEKEAEKLWGKDWVEEDDVDQIRELAQSIDKAYDVEFIEDVGDNDIIVTQTVDNPKTKGLAGGYSSTHSFVDNNKGLDEKAEKYFGKDWEAEDDVDQIQEFIDNALGGGYEVTFHEEVGENDIHVYKNKKSKGGSTYAGGGEIENDMRAVFNTHLPNYDYKPTDEFKEKVMSEMFVGDKDKSKLESTYKKLVKEYREKGEAYAGGGTIVKQVRLEDGKLYNEVAFRKKDSKGNLTNETYVEYHPVEKKKKEKGGSIENQYEGMTAKEVWNAWTPNQRYHFLADHFEKISNSDANDFSFKKWDELRKSAKMGHRIKNKVEIHIREGQYKDGGGVKGVGLAKIKDAREHFSLSPKEWQKLTPEEKIEIRRTTYKDEMRGRKIRKEFDAERKEKKGKTSNWFTEESGLSFLNW